MVIVVMGVSGSGKTVVGDALAKRLNWVFEDADNIALTATAD
jgi:gluconokinase